MKKLFGSLVSIALMAALVSPVYAQAKKPCGKAVTDGYCIAITTGSTNCPTCNYSVVDSLKGTWVLKTNNQCCFYDRAELIKY